MISFKANKRSRVKKCIYCKNESIQKHDFRNKNNTINVTSTELKSPLK